MRTPNTDITDDQILAYIKGGQQIDLGFRLLLQKYQERLYWHVRRMVIDHEDANDVLQNALIKVYRNIAKFEQKSQLYTWLYRIATNETLTFLNKRQRKATTSIEDEQLQLANKLEADAYFSGDEVQLQLQKALLTLPEKQRTVFQLRYYEEMAYKDMSEVLGTSVGALKASYHHAVKKIEQQIKKVGQF